MPEVAFRAKMSDSGTSGGGKGGPTFDGTGDYQAWKGHWLLESLDDATEARKGCIRSLRLGPQTQITARITAKTASNPYQTVHDVFAVLDPTYAAEGLSERVALQQLSRLRQKGDYGTYLQEFNRLAAHTTLTDGQKVAMFLAGVEGRIAAAASVLTEQGFATVAATLAQTDRMTPRGGGGNRGRGGGRGGRGGTTGRQASTRDMSTIECYSCGKKGHFERNCRSKAKKAETKEKESPEEAEDITEHYSGNE